MFLLRNMKNYLRIIPITSNLLYFMVISHRVVSFKSEPIYLKTEQLSGLPQSGINIWKMKFFPGQGKVREFCGWPGKFRKDLESQGI